jgi:hypothetical protein
MTSLEKTVQLKTPTQIRNTPFYLRSLPQSILLSQSFRRLSHRSRILCSAILNRTFRLNPGLSPWLLGIINLSSVAGRIYPGLIVDLLNTRTHGSDYIDSERCFHRICDISCWCRSLDVSYFSVS